VRYVYTLLIYCLVPFVLVRLLWRARLAPAYKKRWAERFAFAPVPDAVQHGIWLHTVSVGEVIAATPLIRKLCETYPSTPIIVTTMTPTGSERVKENCPDQVFHTYVPYDLPGTVNRFLSKLKPKILILMETELWPNLLHYTHRANTPIMIANGRLSPASSKGYARFGGMGVVKPMMACLSMIAAQSPIDAERFKKIGARDDQVKITGNMKFDLQIPATLQESAENLRQGLGAGRPVWVAASTHEGEEEQVLRAFKRIKRELPDALLILVPRHPERFAKVHQLCKKLDFKVARRSLEDRVKARTDVYLGDTMGELMLFLAASDLAYIGGSLVPTGGHNCLEAAAFSKPIVTGPHYFNFLHITQMLIDAKGVKIVDNRRELATAVLHLLQTPDEAEQLGHNANQVVQMNKGALERHLKLINQLIKT
jgi:3-deoxy-D-manno-octulosonic-acid transferase